MQLGTLIISAILTVAVAMADEWHEKKINHDKVKPFPQLEPTTAAERAAIMFKPQLNVQNGCNPYPVVNDAGEISGGLKASGPPRGECKGSKYGSQIYARSQPINGVFAIMYMWYFPKSSKSRHCLRTVVVMIDNPEHENPHILGCSLSAPTPGLFTTYMPCPADYISGHSIKIKYEQIRDYDHTVNLTDVAGTFQDLVMWENMSEPARIALNSAKFDGAKVDINDKNFVESLKTARGGSGFCV